MDFASIVFGADSGLEQVQKSNEIKLTIKKKVFP